MKDFDVSVVGELNIDFILNEIDSFPEIGKEILSRQMNITLGSSSAIFANNLSCLNSKVAFIGKIGTDIFGDMVLKSLQTSGVEIKSIIRDENLKTGATVALNFGEDRAMVTHPGAMDHLSYEDIDWEIITNSRHLHISSYFIQKGIKNDIGRIFKQAKAYGLTTSFDPQWDPSEKWELDLNQILPFVDVFLPNKKELFHLTKTSTIEDAIAVIDPFANTVVIKLGAEGSLRYHDKKSYHLSAFLNTQVVDAIGAGDSFNAGYISQFIRGYNHHICQEFGNMVGAFSTTASGGTGAFTNPDSLIQRIKENYGYAEK